jgi:predicted aspartyl protease
MTIETAGEPALTADRMPGPDRRLLLAGLGATLGGFSGLPASAQDNGTQDAVPLAPGPDVTEIRLLTNLFNRVGAWVHIDGQGPFVFVIDTGAGTTSIADTVADRLGLPAGDPVLVHGITEAAMAPTVLVERLELNGMGFSQLRCPVFQRSQLGADGLIGLDVLSRFRLRFDVALRTATLTLRGVRIVLGGDVQTGSRIRRGRMNTVRGRYGQMVLTQVQVDGQTTSAFVDSGAQYSIGNLALRDAISARNPNRRRAPRPVPVYGVTGQRLNAELLQVDDLRLGLTRLGPTPLLFADLHAFETLEMADRPALLIGADVLSRFREVVLDFPDNAVAFTGRRPPSTRALNRLDG